MGPLLDAATELAALLPPSKVEAIASRLRGASPPRREQDLQQVVGTPAARAALESLITAWQKTTMSGDIVAGMLMGAAHTRQRMQRDCSVELVWTGPMTPFVAPRRTEQVLLDVIRKAKRELFIVSFVAYDVPSVIAAINSATDLGVDTRILVEASLTQGGSLLVDPVSTMRNAVPSAKLYVWTHRPHPFTNGRVHAKMVVADGAIAFLTSANLTGHAIEKNMEAGVLLTGGHIPSSLRDHLYALIKTNVIRPI
ncbi:DISARM system phospholipase D-like protein DrmC [Roseomonas sp. NAR14]|uniref:Phospholipase D n=1 Tax=Roseomonas acroporae TaxID=2937791 RepID=A0A9X2BWX6_9PROT|nr:DISARM system phospholipase D-like protein DrmC [Roseomonas acroporae]MCK8786581.1 DISARM system phospholipase D-like protein DrmC [Roseomonas acroporae]